MVQPASVDLKLGTSFRVFHNHRLPAIDLARAAVRRDRARADRRRRQLRHPSRRVRARARTVEWVELPDDIVARIEGKSSLGRLGLIVHATAGFVDPGFSGTLTLEITNLTRVPIVLWPGKPIAQLSFMALDQAAERPYGHPRSGEPLPRPGRRPRSPATKAGRARSRKLGEIRFKFVAPFPIQVAEDGIDGSHGDNTHFTKRVTLPSGKTIEVVYFADDRPLADGRRARCGRAAGRRAASGSPRLRRVRLGARLPRSVGGGRAGELERAAPLPELRRVPRGRLHPGQRRAVRRGARPRRRCAGPRLQAPRCAPTWRTRSTASWAPSTPARSSPKTSRPL